VELLVVIAVIAILAVLLLPALFRAKARAMETKCAANLRAWGQAFYLYAPDNNGYLPHTDDEGRNTPPFSYDANHPEHESCYADVLPPCMGERPWRDHPDGQKPTGGIWQCPLARPLPDSAYNASFKPSSQGYHSYVMNSYLEHDFLYGLPFGASVQPSFLKFEKCSCLSKTILMFEQTLDPGQGYGQAGGFDTAGRYTAEDPRALGERHKHDRGGLAGNVLYLDAHVGWRDDLWNRTLTNPRIPKRGDLTWFPYDY
jgi:prepilin-type processing-associated H-X9-DG protein